MQKYLYQDLYNLEASHWWHKAKRNLVGNFLMQNLKNPKSKILDVGCGTGKNLESFSKFGIVSGIDNSKEALAFCKKRDFKNVTLGNIEKMPFKKNSFDAITALDVLEHVNDKKALKEISRVLNNDGLLVLTVPAFEWLWSKWDEVLFHKRRYSKKDLTKVLEDNGFIVMEISYIYSFLVLPVLVVRAIKKIFYKNQYPSDFLMSNSLINNILYAASNIERLLMMHFKIPLGTSIIAVAKKVN